MYAAIAGNTEMVRLLSSEAGLVTKSDTIDYPKGTSALLMAMQ